MLIGMGKQLKFWFLATLTTLVVLAGSILQVGEPLMAAPIVATDCQNTCAIALANQLYSQYPDIPKASQADTTLLSRFIDYHLNHQARPAQYHLDWELSMADYLNASYSDAALQSETTAADKLAMQSLNQQQRYALVRSLEQRFAR
ncbi:MAG: hypothetical protein ACFB2W_14220 [Leptolyngbyaceae cyanobacterium]